MKKMLAIIGTVLLIGVVFYSLRDDSNKIERSNNTNTLYKYVLDVNEYVINTTEDGRNVIALKYSFTNNDDDEQSFYGGIDDSVFQNGIKLNKAYDFQYTNYETYIKSGASVDVILVYELIDTTSDVEVQLQLGGTTIYYDEDEVDKKITKIIKIAE